MTPAARVQAAAEIIDEIIGGAAAEQALTRWARASRFAGSKDRAAIRDHVYDVIRCWRSTAASGGGESGRARMIGLMRLQGVSLDEVFSGQGHGAAPLTSEEQSHTGDVPVEDARDCPDWIWDRLSADYDTATAQAQVDLWRSRAPLDLRVNRLKSDVQNALETLAKDGIKAEPHALSKTALRVTEGPRKVAQSEAFKAGLVELQDVASQAVVDALPLRPGQRVLDFCAGGGGKSLAMAARLGGDVDAYDIASARMKTIPERAERAGAKVHVMRKPRGTYDFVFCDAPCSGSGSWRRDPHGKWSMTAEKLEQLQQSQIDVLNEAKSYLREGGTLAYATCSLFACENQDTVARFLDANRGFALQTQRQFTLSDGGDGFYVAVIK